MREIGSEFPYVQLDGIQKPNRIWDTGTLVFSGRTAIETVLKNEPAIRKALLPSYCCDSMVEPFRRAGIEVSFYPVEYRNGLQIDLTIPKDVDCLLWCNYFGFRKKMVDVSDFVARGGIVIEDITHSLFSEHPYHEDSHYLVASVRKWEAVLSGGYCVSRKGPMTFLPTIKPPADYVKQKTTAMQMKAHYLGGEHGVQKDEFLQMFAQSNHWLAENYSGLAIDDYSRKYLQNADVLAHAEIRKRNACPLFLPVVIEPNKRDAIRKTLIEHQIYCPVHWQKPNSDRESNLYDIELSLICDERYNEEDMYRIASVLNNLILD